MPPPLLVFVTGATGFIAAHTIAQLLAVGYRVRASVRDLSHHSRVAFLREMPHARERLELVEADLLTPGAFDAPVDGCDVVLHMASPYVLDVADPQRDLVAPALTGTTSVLGACARTRSVRRVVITSSFAAITDEPDGRVLTEADWNGRSSLTRNPYYYSKTVAERAAWDFVATARPAWDLLAINPFLVLGPSCTRNLNTSNRIIADMLNGVYPGIVGLTWGIVDVRDVAAAHVRAVEAPASGRYLCAAGTMSMREMVQLLGERGYATRQVSRINLDHPVGHVIVRLGSYLRSKGAGQYLRTHIGRVPRFDNARIQRELGVTFRDVAQTVLDAAADLDRWGHLRGAHRAPLPAQR